MEVFFMTASIQGTSSDSIWPSLPLAAWQDTYATLHLWTQIVGKIRLALAPNLNHWWQSTLYCNAIGADNRGDSLQNPQFRLALTHSLISYEMNATTDTIIMVQLPEATKQLEA
jgi:hypothetical protein